MTAVNSRPDLHGKAVIIHHNGRNVRGKINDTVIGSLGTLFVTVSVDAAQDVDLEANWLPAREVELIK